MTRIHRVLVVFLLASGLAASVAATPPGDTQAKPRPAVLPAWAPKHPSREFLRAAKVLKPVPEEAQPYSPVYVPAWELFGSLTDQQVKQLLTLQQHSQPLAGMAASRQKYLQEKSQARQVGDKMVWYEGGAEVSAKSFTPRQRAIFASLVKAWGKANPGGLDEDLLVFLYKARAKRDLSNVWVGFSVLGGHAVKLGIAVRTPPMSGGTETATDYSSTGTTPVWIAQL